jgi:hypothetical protein
MGNVRQGFSQRQAKWLRSDEILLRKSIDVFFAAIFALRKSPVIEEAQPIRAKKRLSAADFVKIL